MTALVADILRKFHSPHFGMRLDFEPFFRFLVRMICYAIYYPRYTGFEHIPQTGAAIIICNHVSYVDGLIIAAGCRRPVRFVIDTHIYNVPIVHYFMKLNRAIPILPTRESVTQALEAISAGIKAGDLICIFPEGQLTYTGSLGRFKTGIESIIKRDPAPVYPVALTGLWGSIFSRKHLGSWKRFIPKHIFKRTHAICGDLIPPEHVTVNRLQKAVLRLKYLAQG
jgi:1-acyl-sn-glycerol-3-phosphate acyltransferase